MLKPICAAKLAATLIVWTLPFAGFAQAVPIPDFIKMQPTGMRGQELYFHAKLYPGLTQGWIDKDTDEELDVYFLPMVTRGLSGIESDGGVRYGISIQFGAHVGRATKLDRFEIKADTDTVAQIIQFDSWTKLDSSTNVGFAGNEASCTLGTRSERRRSITVRVMDGPALPLTEKMAFQSEERIPNIRLVTDEGDVTFDVPISVSKPLREFLEWAEEFFKAGGVAWPSVDE